MFEGLSEAIDELVVPTTGDAIVELRALADRLEATIAGVEADYSKSSGWDVDGYGSMAAFERHRCRLGNGVARQVAARAGCMAAWPEYLEAWQDGTITGAQVAATVALVPDRHVERFAGVAGENAQIVSPLIEADTRSVLRDWVDKADQFAEREAADAGVEVSLPPPARELSASRTLDDELAVRGGFDASSAVFIEKALTAASRPDLEGERRTPTERRADALVEVCKGYLRSLKDPDGNRTTEQLTVVAEITALYRAALRGAGVRTTGELDEFLAARPMLGALERGLFLDAFDGKGGVARTLDGSPIGDGLLSSLSSGGTLERLLTVDGRILDMGRSVRLFTPAQRRAILARDGGRCRRAGCDRPAHQCSVHHVEPWESGGLTDVANGVTKCDHEHLDDHRKGWHDELGPDGTYTVITPTGERLSTRPTGLSPPAELPVPTHAAPAPALPFDPSSARPTADEADLDSGRTDGPPVIEALRSADTEGDLHRRVSDGLVAHAHLDTRILDRLPRRREQLTGLARLLEGLSG